MSAATLAVAFAPLPEGPAPSSFAGSRWGDRWCQDLMLVSMEVGNEDEKKKGLVALLFLAHGSSTADIGVRGNSFHKAFIILLRRALGIPSARVSPTCTYPHDIEVVRYHRSYSTPNICTAIRTTRPLHLAVAQLEQSLSHLRIPESSKGAQCSSANQGRLGVLRITSPR